MSTKKSYASRLHGRLVFAPRALVIVAFCFSVIGCSGTTIRESIAEASAYVKRFPGAISSLWTDDSESVPKTPEIASTAPEPKEDPGARPTAGAEAPQHDALHDALVAERFLTEAAASCDADAWRTLTATAQTAATNVPGSSEMTDFVAAREARALGAIQRFLAKHPGGNCYDKARNERRRQIERAQSAALEGCDPEGWASLESELTAQEKAAESHKMAAARIEPLIAAHRVGSEAAYRAVISDHFDAGCVNRAKKELLALRQPKLLEAGRACDLERWNALRAQADQFGEGSSAVKKLDAQLAAFSRARAANTVDAYDALLKSDATSVCAAAARRAFAELMEVDLIASAQACDLNRWRAHVRTMVQAGVDLPPRLVSVSASVETFAAAKTANIRSAYENVLLDNSKICNTEARHLWTSLIANEIVDIASRCAIERWPSVARDLNRFDADLDARHKALRVALDDFQSALKSDTFERFQHFVSKMDKTNAAEQACFEQGRRRLTEKYWSDRVAAAKADGDRNGKAHALAQKAAFYKANRRDREHLSVIREMANEGIVDGEVALAVEMREKGDTMGAKRKFTALLGPLTDTHRYDLLEKVHFQLGTIYREEKRSEDALKHLTEAIKASRLNKRLCGPCLFVRGQVYLTMDLKPQAKNDFRLLIDGSDLQISRRSEYRERAERYVSECIEPSDSARRKCEQQGL